MSRYLSSNLNGTETMYVYLCQESNDVYTLEVQTTQSGRSGSIFAMWTILYDPLIMF